LRINSLNGHTPHLLQRAARDYASAIRLSPSRPELYIQWGNILFKLVFDSAGGFFFVFFCVSYPITYVCVQGDLKSATQQVQRAMTLSSRTSNMQNTRAQVLSLLGAHDEAVKLLDAHVKELQSSSLLARSQVQSLLTFHRDLAPALVLLAQTLMRAKRFAEAAAQFESAVGAACVFYSG
jgi:tetratricopeptide (TPR) repeat protein